MCDSSPIKLLTCWEESHDYLNQRSLRRQTWSHSSHIPGGSWCSISNSESRADKIFQGNEVLALRSLREKCAVCLQPPTFLVKFSRNSDVHCCSQGLWRGKNSSGCCGEILLQNISVVARRRQMCGNPVGCTVNSSIRKEHENIYFCTCVENFSHHQFHFRMQLWIHSKLHTKIYLLEPWVMKRCYVN